jgi:hypothetical protein
MRLMQLSPEGRSVQNRESRARLPGSSIPGARLGGFSFQSILLDRYQQRDTSQDLVDDGPDPSPIEWPNPCKCKAP